MTVDTLSLAHTALCTALVWTCFCRLVKTNHETYPTVRLGLFVLAVSSLAGAVAPWLWGFKPQWPSALLAVGMLATQTATARFWAYGTPCQFQRGPR